MGRTRRDRITALGELQLQVLDALSELGEATVYDVIDRFPEAGQPRYSTVQTVLRSLERKGLVTHRTEGRTFIFRATAKSREVRGTMLGDMVARVFGGSPRALVSALLDTEAVSHAELAQIKALIEERERDPRGGGAGG